MRTAKRIEKLPPYLFAEIDRKVAEAQAKGADIISFGVGDPDLPSPPHVVEALAEGRARPRRRISTRRTPGCRSSVRSIAEWYGKRFGVTLDADDEVQPLVGSKEGIFHLPVAFIDPGDVALIPDPGYPVYETGTILAGGEPYLMPLTGANGFKPDFGSIPPDVLKRAKVMWLNYPSEPNLCSRGSGVLQRSGRVLQAARSVTRSRRGVHRDDIRRLRCAQRAASRRSDGRCDRVPLAVEDLQHDRVAHRLGGRSTAGDRGDQTTEDEHRLRDLRRGAARRHRRDRGPSGPPGEVHRALPPPTRPAVRRA